MATLIELLRKYPNVDSSDTELENEKATSEYPKSVRSKSPSTTSSKSQQKQSPATSKTVAAK